MTHRLESIGVSLELRDQLAIIHLSKPPVNALTPEMKREILVLAGKLQHLSDIHVVIIASDLPQHFSAGSDLNRFPRTAEESFEYSVLEHNTYDAIEDLEQVTIAAISGYAIGGGIELALTTDLRLADSTAIFGFPELELGVFPSGGGTTRLPKLVGESAAAELILTGDRIDAHEARRLGLVNRVVEPGLAMESAIALGVRLASRNPRALRAAKRCMRDSLRNGASSGRRTEIREIAKMWHLGSVAENVQEFFAKEDSSQATTEESQIHEKRARQ